MKVGLALVVAGLVAGCVTSPVIVSVLVTEQHCINGKMYLFRLTTNGPTFSRIMHDDGKPVACS